MSDFRLTPDDIPSWLEIAERIERRGQPGDKETADQCRVAGSLTDSLRDNLVGHSCLICGQTHDNCCISGTECRT